MIRATGLLTAFLLAAGLGNGSAAMATDTEADPAVALGRNLDQLAAEPGNRDARLAAWRAAVRLGLFEQAASLEAPLSVAEQRTLEGDRIALQVRYGVIDANSQRGEVRFAALDRSLAATDDDAAAFLAGGPADTETQRRLTDRVSALSARRRAADAFALHDALVARGVAIPPWTQRDLADSALQLREPEWAAELYRAFLATAPDDFVANIGLFYALADAGDIDAATAHIDAYAARLPERRHRDGRYNGERLSADIAGDRARAWANRLDEAQRRSEARLAAAPFNAEARGTAASLALARGWPHLGEQTLRRIVGSDPDNPALYADLAEARLQLQDWLGARAALAAGEGIDAENTGVRRAHTSLALHDSFELWVEAGYGKGGDTGGFFGNSDWRIDSYLYAPPLAENWRVFAHNYTSSADFDGSTTNWTRTGIGAEWRHLAWRATAEVNSGDGVKPGLLATARWKPDDQWSVYAAGETVTNQIPLRAVREGVTAARAEVGVDWRLDESRKLALATTLTDFSDDNRRNAVSTSWFERWASGPRWMFETTLGADASHNTADQSVAYFNPKTDHSLWLTAAVDNLAWRRYDFALRQRLALTAGNYWQKDYGSGAIEAIEYGHRWELGRAVAFNYSLGRLLRPYDGVREGRTFATMSLLWRF
ncbi:MAG: poly-beta-1,6 N-acetyl-D-glucosamine export porin PgaA [Betaproteobacteria bacterium]|nr:poly-beta-1,6 N-acetyl-D-glucosamine export porin PgaA [Betaproteobacteria bacterium]